MNSNPLYPVFFKLDRLRLLVVGAGEVGYEKISFILKSSPNANIKVVATWVSDDVNDILKNERYTVDVQLKSFEPKDIDGCDLVVAATNMTDLNRAIYKAAKSRSKIVNVADTPSLCDFYMGSIVTRGDLKIGISTNGQSPTLAKRFRQLLEEVLPADTQELIENLKMIRDRMHVGFNEKVKQLNKITASILQE